MEEIKCPKCGEIFKVDESGYAAIVKQVRDSEFQKEIAERENVYANDKKSAVEVAVTKTKAESERELAEKNMEIERLKNQITMEKANSELVLKTALQDKEKQIAELNNELKLKDTEWELKEKDIEKTHSDEINKKDEEIAYYKDYKARLSTKMIGEGLEQHCQTEFNKLRATAFPTAYFEKDNDAKNGSKGDYIYRESSDDGVEFISIMFEMKNEMETTATKHKNEDFFKELDKDRQEKNCEYAVLVSMLEADSELYNEGIVDVSYKYPKMYVIRPQFFIPIITILRNAAKNSLNYKRELVRIQNQNIDITNFENEILQFKDDFSRNVDIASRKFQTAVEEIDKTIDHLNKIKENLLASSRQLSIANKKADDLSIKKLTKNNPTMREKFDALSDGESK